jgi:hypothetical protein
MSETHSCDAEVAESAAWRSVADTVAVVQQPGAGLGVVATRDVAAGECLLQERPLLLLTPDGAGRYNGAFRGDPEHAKLLLLTLSAAKPGAGQLGSVIETNGIIIRDGAAAAFTAVHHLISRCNHSCVPNAAFSWDAEAGVGRLVAELPIRAGEAIEFNYGARGSRARRQRRLQQRFCFECACELCSLSGAPLEASDAEEEARLWGGTLSDSDEVDEEVEEEHEEGTVGVSGEGLEPLEPVNGTSAKCNVRP